jgi:replicative DNA helicase
MVADCCSIGCNQIYNKDKRAWETIGKPEPTIYIATEQDLGEVQTMMLAFVSGVDEEHILTGTYFEGEWERIIKAKQILKESPIYFESLPDFSLLDIENTIKRNIRERDVKYIFHDYLHTSMKILEEITKRSGGVRLREDNILFMVAIRLKDICNQYGVFIMTATQLNADYVDSETPDQNLLRGAKSIADKIDVGMIMLELTQKDRESIKDIVAKGGFEEPIIKISVYKNRRGRWKGIYLWCRADRGCCRIEPMFVTKWNYELVEMEDLKIYVRDESAF